MVFVFDWMLYLQAGGVVLAAMLGLWVLSLIMRNSSIVDIFWGTGFVLVAWFSFLAVGEPYPARSILLNILVTIWGLRLSIHILLRNWGKEEDYRYQEWREEAGESWWWKSLFRVFLLQGFIMWIVASPLVAVNGSQLTGSLTWLDLAAGALWVVGFVFEAGGDWQLARFKADPDSGKLMTSGLWSLTRHPNYFGNATQWWAFYLFAVGSGAALTIVSPILMTYLIRYVSGVELLEEAMSKRPGWEEYAEKTPPFIPRLANLLNGSPEKKHTAEQQGEVSS